MQTKFKPIPGFKGYFISKDGVVVVGAKKTLRTYLKNGYLAVDLWRDKRTYHRYIHRLILEVFTGETKPWGWQCRHLDGNKLNNKLANLRWGTYSENQMDRVGHGTDNRGEKHGMSKYTKEFVLKIRNLCKNNMQKDIANKLGLSKSTISWLAVRGWKWLK